MPNAEHNQASTEFGAGEVPPEEFFVHGQNPARSLPCNDHDVCYQTFGSTQAACDDDMYDAMMDVCFQAYPPPSSRPAELREKLTCSGLAWAYYGGLSAAGAGAHCTRQREYGVGGAAEPSC